MKNDKIFLNMLKSKESIKKNGVVAIEWEEFIERLNLQNMATRDIKKNVFSVLLRSKLVAKYFPNLQLETIKFYGRGNKIQKLIISFLDENIDEVVRDFNKDALIKKLKNDDLKKYNDEITKINLQKEQEKSFKKLARESKKKQKILNKENAKKIKIQEKIKKIEQEKSFKKLEREIKKEILNILRKEKILKYSEIYIDLKNRFGVRKIDLSKILKTLVEKEKIFIFDLLYNKGNKFLSIENDKFAVIEFSEKQKQKYFYNNDGFEFLKSFCYKASMNLEPVAHKKFFARLQQAIKQNFDLFFDFKVLENITNKAKDFIIWTTNYQGTRYFSFYQKSFSKDELNQIKNNSKKWKFVKF